MNEVRVTSYSGFYRLYSLFSAIAGLFILGVLLKNYITQQLESDWYFSLFIGSYAFIYGVGALSGWIKTKVPEIVVNGDGIRSNTTDFTDTFRWKRFQNVKLDKSRISVEYTKSHLNNSLKIPLFIRLSSKKMKELRDAISLQCDLHRVPFESEI